MTLVNGRKIVELRLARGWKQKDLVTASGVTAAVVSRIERGLQADYNVSVIIAIANAFDVPVDELLYRNTKTDRGEIVGELYQLLLELSEQPEPIQRQAIGMLRGFLSALN